jgi:DNA-binding NtrC family response regulator
MTDATIHQEVDLYVWEGTSDLVSRAERCLTGYDVTVVRADAGLAFPPPRDPLRPAVALVSVSIMGDSRFSGHDWLASQGIPVIWVASEERGRDSRYYPPAYSHTLPLAFTGSELRGMLFRLAGIAQATQKAERSKARPLIAVSSVMRDLLREAETFADCRAAVLIHGETGVGKERVARLLHDEASWSNGPFVAVNCGAVPEGLFEAHFFGHAKGAFTGAVGAHKGYFEQSSGGTLFLDEIGDMPLYQQVKLLRVLEQNTITRLGSTTEIEVDFRLVAATNKNLRALVADGQFRADLYYRLAVIELQVPNLEARGPEEKIAIFKALMQHHVPNDATVDDVPDWLLDRIARLVFPGNVRELSNIAERVAILRRQLGTWDQARLERVFNHMYQAPSGAAGRANGRAVEVEPPSFSPAELAERNRIQLALDANGWRRQDTATMLGISRKVLWEKMRKFQLGQSETAEGAVEAS